MRGKWYNPARMVILLMGVSGAGKTTVGQSLAAALGWRFYDADDFHPPDNVAKMRAGQPLTDADRAPWLAAVRAVMAATLRADESAVMACSALKRAYRAQLACDPARVKTVYLRGDYALIERRLQNRPGHFMPAALLASQFAALEEPTDAVVIDAAQSVSASVAHIQRELGLTIT